MQKLSHKIVVVGSINADLTVQVERHPQPGETLLGRGGEVTPGGKGANQAVAAARLGADVALVGAVGDDAYAGPATSILRECVTTSTIARVDEVTGLAVITVAADGENTIIVAPGANARVDSALVAGHAELIGGAEIVLLQGEIPASGFAKAVELARGRVVVNLAPVIEVDHAALLKADPLVANEHEAGLILAQFGGGADATAASPEAIARALLECGFASVVLTLGKAGSLVATSEGLTTIPAAHVPPEDTVDTVGAGDAYTGALCHRLVEGDTLVEAARFAARVSAFAVTRTGAQPSYPTASDELPPLD
ncbi:ribokinase [Corynebacterium cystitidis]|uniref:Ribokinase n=1 Tax=Corynebacterium cystitidis DSM 20524 TaxID=1121357 RepID=A0A1H9SU73_9CORY|nr:ribokinase [Corynebacterium cystitidis]WJY83187.1 Ribokinase [Corynebacterium cystitidis DSM 20524]SER88404.1 ribokinase [Corynebacterium cystitidis DSM 20524]SNV67258.1 ribokinase [Corynebacterium cystitidis]